jgi:flagellar hook-length control protein FliK
MIAVSTGKIEASSGVKPKEADANEKTDNKKKNFITELEHFLGQASDTQVKSPNHTLKNRFSQRASYLRMQHNEKHRVGILFPRITGGRNTVHDLRVLEKLKKLNGWKSDGYEAQLRKNAKLSYLKKRSASNLLHSAKGSDRYTRLSKYMNDIAEGLHKNKKTGIQHKSEQVSETNVKKNSRAAKGKYRLMMYRKQNRPVNMEGKAVIQTSQEGRKSGAKDLTLVCTKYESNVPKLETGVRIQAHNYINKKGDDIFSEIVKQFTLIVNKGGGEARISLEPPSLGNMKLNIKLNNSEVNTHIVVDNMSLKDLIESRISMLQESLFSQGFTLGSFSVEVKAKNTSPQMTGDGKNAGAVVNNTEEGIESDPQVLRMIELPWISTIVNITV